MWPRSSLNRKMHTLSEGVQRLTFSLPLGIDHVHCYLLAAEGRGWTLVDTALGLPGAEERWREVLAELDGPVERIVLTHFHPDHVGGAADVAALTGAPVFQGRLDYEQCLGAWDDPGVRDRVSRHMLAHGMPASEVEAVCAHHDRLVPYVHFARDPDVLEPGDRIDGWEVLHLPGHADGHLSLLRNGVLVAGDALLGDITPNVGLWPASSPDPLADYLGSLDRVVELDPVIALPGHGEPIPDPAGRARTIREHHGERLELAVAALDGVPRSAYDVSLALFPGDLSPVLRRFALAEALAHLEYLALKGEIARVEDAGRVRYAVGAAR